MSVFRYAAVVLAVGSLAGVIYAVASGAGQSSVTAQRFVNLQEGAKPHEGFRRAHAKGFCVAGEFLSNGKLAPYSTAQVFQPGKTGFVGRMSIAGTNPTAPDLRSPVRSLALNLGQGDADGWRTAMNTPPVMAVGTPEAFYEQLSALAPDPATGQRNPQRIQAFFEGVFKTVMHGIQRLRGNRGSGQVRRTFQADGKGMQPRPPGFGLVVFLDAMACVARGDRGDQ